MTNEKLTWIENYLQAKKGDEDKDVDQTLVHNWKPFTIDEIREVVDMLTKNDIRRFIDSKYRYFDEHPEVEDLIEEFGIEFRDQFGKHQYGVFNDRLEELEYKDSERNCDLYCKLNNFIREHEIDRKTWNKFLKYHNTFKYEYDYHFTYKKDIEGKLSWEILGNLEKWPIPPHMIEKNKGEMGAFWRLQFHERMNSWFEANVEGYKEYED